MFTEGFLILCEVTKLAYRLAALLRDRISRLRFLLYTYPFGCLAVPVIAQLLYPISHGNDLRLRNQIFDSEKPVFPVKLLLCL